MGGGVRLEPAAGTVAIGADGIQFRRARIAGGGTRIGSSGTARIEIDLRRRQAMVLAAGTSGGVGAVGSRAAGVWLSPAPDQRARRDGQGSVRAGQCGRAL